MTVLTLDAALVHAAAALNPLPAECPPDELVSLRADALRVLCDHIDPSSKHLGDIAVALWVEGTPEAWEAA